VRYSRASGTQYKAADRAAAASLIYAQSFQTREPIRRKAVCSAAWSGRAVPESDLAANQFGPGWTDHF